MIEMNFFGIPHSGERSSGVLWCNRCSQRPFRRVWMCKWLWVRNSSDYSTVLGLWYGQCKTCMFFLNSVCWSLKRTTLAENAVSPGCMELSSRATPTLKKMLLVTETCLQILTQPVLIPSQTHSVCPRPKQLLTSRTTTKLGILPGFKPWRSRYESVNYGISNYWFT